MVKSNIIEMSNYGAKMHDGLVQSAIIGQIKHLSKIKGWDLITEKTGDIFYNRILRSETTNLVYEM